jgi:hypothetical protein
MVTQVLQFGKLSDQDLEAAQPFGRLGEDDQIEIRIRRETGEDQVLMLPDTAASLLKVALNHLYRGERVVVLAKDQEVSPSEPAAPPLR